MDKNDFVFTVRILTEDELKKRFPPDGHGISEVIEVTAACGGYSSRPRIVPVEVGAFSANASIANEAIAIAKYECLLELEMEHPDEIRLSDEKINWMAFGNLRPAGSQPKGKPTPVERLRAINARNAAYQKAHIRAISLKFDKDKDAVVISKIDAAKPSRVAYIRRLVEADMSPTPPTKAPITE